MKRWRHCMWTRQQGIQPHQPLLGTLLVLVGLVVFPHFAHAASVYVNAPATNGMAAQQSPAKALENVQSALDTGDIVLFEQHVDMDALVRGGVEYFLADAKNDGGSQLPPVLAMIMSTVGQTETGKMSLHSLVGSEARNFVVYGVQSGNFAGSNLGNVPPPEGLLAPLFAEASLGRKEIRQARAPQMRGSDCLISFVVYDYGNGRSYPVTALWQVVKGHWRMVKVENLPTLIAQIRREAVE